MSAAPINATDPDDPRPYVDRETLKQRIEYEPGDFFQDEHNQYKRFDLLLDRLLEEATSIVNNHTGDQTWHRETDRQDVFAEPTGRVLPLVYPVVEVSDVEWLRLERSGTQEYRDLPEGRYRALKHGVKLRKARTANPRRDRRSDRANPLVNAAASPEWGDVAREIRVTYTRGYESIPREIQQITTTLVRRMLRNRKNEQNVSAASPDELGNLMADMDTVISEPIKAELEGLTTLGRATYTV